MFIYGKSCIYVMYAETLILVNVIASKLSMFSNYVTQANICQIFLAHEIPESLIFSIWFPQRFY